MLSYFDDQSLTVIQIRNLIVLSHFDFAISLLKRYHSYKFLFNPNESTAIKQLLKHVYL